MVSVRPWFKNAQDGWSYSNSMPSCFHLSCTQGDSRAKRPHGSANKSQYKMSPGCATSGQISKKEMPAQRARGFLISRLIRGCVMSLLNMTPSKTCEEATKAEEIRHTEVTQNTSLRLERRPLLSRLEAAFGLEVCCVWSGLAIRELSALDLLHLGEALHVDLLGFDRRSTEATSTEATSTGGGSFRPSGFTMQTVLTA